MRPEAFTGGFDAAPIQSSRAFRALLEAMARPGTIWHVEGVTPPAPLSIAAGIALLTLADGTTPVHLAGVVACEAVRDWITFHAGAPICVAEEATFAVGDWQALHPLDRFSIGTPDYPDRSTTLIVELPKLEADGPLLRGPGIRETIRLSLPETAAFRANRALFPQGFDCILTCGNRLAGLPRSTSVGDN